MLPKSLVGINSVPRILNQAKIFFPAEVSTAGCSDGETWRWVLCFFFKYSSTNFLAIVKKDARLCETTFLCNKNLMRHFKSGGKIGLDFNKNLKCFQLQFFLAFCVKVVQSTDF